MDAKRYLQNDHRDELKSGSRTNKGKGPRKQLSRKEQEEKKQAFLLWSHRVTAALKLLLAGVMLGGLMWSLPKLWAWLDRPVARVQVGGSFHYLRQEEVQGKLEPFLHNRFFALNLRGMQRALEDDAWINNVRVRKFWPDRLEVSLDEEVPVARWLSQELLNADGKILSPRPGMVFDDLPALGGPKGREREIMQQYMTLSLQFRPLSLQVEAVNLTPAGSWSFRVGGVNVQLGGDELIDRMQRFSRLYYSKLKPRWKEVKSVDLRYQDGIAVAWLDENRTTGRLAND